MTLITYISNSVHVLIPRHFSFVLVHVTHIFLLWFNTYHKNCILFHYFYHHLYYKQLSQIFVVVHIIIFILEDNEFVNSIHLSLLYLFCANYMYAIKPQWVSFVSFFKQLKQKFPIVLSSHTHCFAFVMQTQQDLDHTCRMQTNHNLSNLSILYSTILAYHDSLRCIISLLIQLQHNTPSSAVL
jgi:hypothetical protein